MRPRTEKKINEANDLIVQGYTIQDACKKVGISKVTYHKLTNKNKVNDSAHKVKNYFPISTQSESELARLRAENESLRRFIKDFL